MRPTTEASCSTARGDGPSLSRRERMTPLTVLGSWLAAAPATCQVPSASRTSAPASSSERTSSLRKRGFPSPRESTCSPSLRTASGQVSGFSGMPSWSATRAQLSASLSGRRARVVCSIATRHRVSGLPSTGRAWHSTSTRHCWYSRVASASSRDWIHSFEASSAQCRSSKLRSMARSRAWPSSSQLKALKARVRRCWGVSWANSALSEPIPSRYEIAMIARFRSSPGEGSRTSTRWRRRERMSSGVSCFLVPSQRRMKSLSRA
ncbi:hypothetical protein D3C87_1361490 [compost metagenome]